MPFSAEDEAFRTEVKAFIQEKLPLDVKQKVLSGQEVKNGVVAAHHANTKNGLTAAYHAAATATDVTAAHHTSVTHE